MSGSDRFELRRRLDDLVYVFERKPGQFVYARRDRPDLQIVYREGFGWGAWSVDGYELQGRPWDVALDFQSPAYPPEGVWVSQKGDKSYVYDLVFT